MEEMDLADEGFDWMTGEYTYKKERLKRVLNEPDYDDFYE